MTNVEDRLKRARIQIQRKNSFFAYLSLFLKLQKNEEIPSMGVDMWGNLHYNSNFVDGLTNDELEGVFIHEILHLALSHLTREGSRDHMLWNVAIDIVDNSLVLRNGFKLPKEGCIPNSADVFEQEGIIIANCSKKIAEEVYDELEKQIKKSMKGKQQGKNNSKGQGQSPSSGQGEGDSDEGEGNSQGGSGKGNKKKKSQYPEMFPEGFDKHMCESKHGKNSNKAKEQEKFWDDKLREAVVVSKMKGDIPKGMERIIEKLHEETINWKSLLYNFITQQIPYNLTYARPNKKSVSIGEYMPDVLKEKIDVVIGIDTSGSIGREELTDFLSEIIGIARAFQQRINMRLITHEVDVNDDYEVRNGNIEKIKKLQIHGGGGTAHKPIFDYIKENVRDCKCAIFLTDGYSDIESINMTRYEFAKIFVISEDGSIPKGDLFKTIPIKKDRK